MNYRKIYNAIIDAARNRTIGGYVEVHHIIPLCMGGTNEQSNLVALTPEEHYLCHVLLVKLHPEQRNLIIAVNKMTQPIKAGRPKRKLVGWLRRRYATRMSELSTGSGNSQHGTRWINCPNEKPRKIKKDEVLPEGWYEGRRLWKKSPTTGTMWINNGNENKLIHKDDTIPSNWKKGRLMNMIVRSTK